MVIVTLHKKKLCQQYIGYHFTIEPRELGSEILIAELGKPHFESFTETETGILRI
jgi:ribosomal protein L11 methyltransferase